MSNLSVFDFNSNNIRFENREGRVWVSLTDMAVASGKRMDNWKRLQATTEFLTEFESIAGIPVIVSNVGGLPATTGTWAIEEVAEKFMQWIEGTRYKRNNGRKGIVYIYVDNGNNAYKIGFTTDLVKREKQHKTSNPFLELVKVFEVESIDVETVIHEKLKCHRIPKTTEWYNKHPDVLKTVQLICTEALSPQ
jgi:predicted GIY-YIG superfamily endonuclease